MPMGLLLIVLAFQDASPYKDDPAIIEALRGLGAHSSWILPPVKVNAGGLTLHGVDKYGPGQRDYCNKMPYAPERRTALYAGGNHQVPHRMNDVWEWAERGRAEEADRELATRDPRDCWRCVTGWWRRRVALRAAIT